MTRFVDSLGIAELVAALMVVAMNAYVLTGGADFGGGVWDLLARGPRRAEQRALIAHEIGPIWEANHVWLILVVVMLFTAFPAAFATLGTVLHIPLTIMLVGIVLRGSAFVFRSYGARDHASQRRWSTTFAAASIVTPLVLGVMVGAIVSGAVGDAAARLAHATAAAPPTFASVYVAPWLAPFPLVIGVLALGMFAFLAATYLAAAASDDALRDDFRRRAFAAAAVMFVAAFGALGVAHVSAPHVRRGLMSTSGGALAFQLATAAAALGALWALSSRRWLIARASAAAQVSLILWGWVLVQYPYIIPPSETARAAAAPRVTLVLLLGALMGGLIVLVPSLAYLFRTFAAAEGHDAAAANGGVDGSR
jgi:cytochrome bd ubiquinol oxidase subunit II